MLWPFPSSEKIKKCEKKVTIFHESKTNTIIIVD